MEIEQLDMAADPVAVVRHLEAFLDLPAHASTRLLEVLAAEQPERTADRFGGVLDLDELGWPIDAKAQFGQTCLGEMEAFGYSIGKTYYAERPAC